jgi:hypothetical protein
MKSVFMSDDHREVFESTYAPENSRWTTICQSDVQSGA